MAANQTELSRLEQSSVIKFLFAEKCKPYEITAEYIMRTEKHVFLKNVFKWTKHLFATTNLSWKNHP